MWQRKSRRQNGPPESRKRGPSSDVSHEETGATEVTEPSFLPLCPLGRRPAAGGQHVRSCLYKQLLTVPLLVEAAPGVLARAKRGPNGQTRQKLSETPRSLRFSVSPCSRSVDD